MPNPLTLILGSGIMKIGGCRKGNIERRVWLKIGEMLIILTLFYIFNERSIFSYGINLDVGIFSWDIWVVWDKLETICGGWCSSSILYDEPLCIEKLIQWQEGIFIPTLVFSGAICVHESCSLVFNWFICFHCCRASIIPHSGFQMFMVSSSSKWSTKGLDTQAYLFQSRYIIFT